MMKRTDRRPLRAFPRIQLTALTAVVAVAAASTMSTSLRAQRPIAKTTTSKPTNAASSVAAPKYSLIMTGKHNRFSRKSNKTTGRIAIDMDGEIRTIKGAVVESAGLTSPDGKWRIRPSKARGIKSLLFVPGRGVPKDLAAEQVGERPTWTPDSRAVVFLARSKGSTIANLYDVYSKTRVTLSPMKGYTASIRISPTGKVIAMRHESLEKRRRMTTRRWQSVKLVARSGKLLHTLCDKTYIGDISFSPDGRKIAVADSSSLKIFAVKNGELLQTRRSGNLHPNCKHYGASSIHWRPDGAELACRLTFLGQTMGDAEPMFGEQQVFIIPLDESQDVRVLDFPKIEGGARYHLSGWHRKT